MQSFQRKKYFGIVFSYYRTWQTSGSNLSGYTRFFEKYCASYMVISSGPKKSRTNFFKKSLSYRRKKFWRLFFTYYPLWHTSSSFLLGSKRCFGKYGTRYKIISLTHPSLLKTQLFGEKRQTFHRKKNFGLLLSFYRSW